MIAWSEGMGRSFYSSIEPLGIKSARCFVFGLIVNLILISVTAGPGLANNNEQFSILAPLERIEFSNDWRKSAKRVLKEGGHAIAIFRLAGNPCASLEASVESVRFYTALPSKLETPSSLGSPTGIYYEALVPRGPEVCHLSPYVFAEWIPEKQGAVLFRSGGSEAAVIIEFDGAFYGPKRPLFIGVTNSYGILGHCSAYCPKEADLAHKYAKMLVGHHIQPIQNWVSFPAIEDGRLDLDDGG